MSGYTPLFSSLITGTLYGKWPDIGLWSIVLSLADKHGVVDATPQYLAGVTGLPTPDIAACMARFCEPDPHSRSKIENGARLVLIDAARDWGWRIVNHSKYREKARLMGKAELERETGKNAGRMRDRRRPPKTAADPLSYSYAYSDKDKTAPRTRGCRVPEPFPITEDMRTWALAKCPHVTNVDGATEEFVDYWRGVAGKAATKIDWGGTWRNRMRQLEAHASQKKPTANGASEWR